MRSAIRLAIVSGATVLLVLHGACKGESMKTLIDAVMSRDRAAVSSLLGRNVDLNITDARGQTPLIAATGTDQFVVAEMLIDHGADVFAMDRMGFTAGQFAEFSSLTPDSENGAARLRVLQKLKMRGFPFPAPNPEKTKALAAQGQWPPRR